MGFASVRARMVLMRSSSVSVGRICSVTEKLADSGDGAAVVVLRAEHDAHKKYP